MSENISEIDKRLVKIQLMGLPGWILIGLGIFGYYYEGDGPAAFLNNESVYITMVLIGTYMAIWEVRKVLPLFKKRKQLESGGNT